MAYNKKCVVPQCPNTSTKTPEKLFISVPKKANIRKKWLQLARRHPNDVGANSSAFFCEDHFNIEKDITNFNQYKMGFSQRLVIAGGVLPSKFGCQQDRSKRLCDASFSRGAYIKRRRLELIQECLNKTFISENTLGTVNHADKEIEEVVTSELIVDGGGDKADAAATYFVDEEGNYYYLSGDSQNLVSLPNKGDEDSLEQESPQVVERLAGCGPTTVDGSGDEADAGVTYFVDETGNYYYLSGDSQNLVSLPNKGDEDSLEESPQVVVRLAGCGPTPADGSGDEADAAATYFVDEEGKYYYLSGDSQNLVSLPNKGDEDSLEPTDMDKQTEIEIDLGVADYVVIKNEEADESTLVGEESTLIKQEPLDQDGLQTCHNAYDSYFEVIKHEHSDNSSEMKTWSENHVDLVTTKPSDMNKQTEIDLGVADYVVIKNEEADDSTLVVEEPTLIKQEPLDQDGLQSCHNAYDSYFEVIKHEFCDNSSEIKTLSENHVNLVTTKHSIMSSKNFVIVTFVNENDARGIVASNWIIDSHTCYYPNVCTEEMKNKLLKRLADPEDTWPQYLIKILKSYETYGKAQLHLRKAEETSNLDSDEEVRKRKRKINSVFLCEDSNSSDEYTPLKMTQARTISIKRRDPSKYPNPPKSIPVARQNTLAEEVQIDLSLSDSEKVTLNENSALDCPVITTQACPSEVEYYKPGCITCKQCAIQQTHLIHIVTDLNNQVAALNKKVDILLERSGGTLTTITTDDAEFSEVSELLGSLPVKDDASFNHFNNQLKINKNKKAIISFLASIGGRNIRNLTNNLMRRILMDDVAELYSLTGKKMKNSHKKSFLQTEVFKLIFQICKKIYEDVTESDIKDIISDWLNQAKVRITRRAERANSLRD